MNPINKLPKNIQQKIFSDYRKTEKSLFVFEGGEIQNIENHINQLTDEYLMSLFNGNGYLFDKDGLIID